MFLKTEEYGDENGHSRDSRTRAHLPDGRSYPIFYHKSITVDDTEKLCYPKGRTFIGGQSIASTFLCSSAVCLLIG